MKKIISGAKYPLTVKKSAIAGHGAFAVKTIPWGKKIVQFKGAIIGDSEAKERAAKGATAIMDLGKGHRRVRPRQWRVLDQSSASPAELLRIA
jgi:hypothetical protein